MKLSTFTKGILITFTLFILFLIFNPIVIVDVGQKKVVKRFGSPTGRVLDPGISFINPFSQSTVTFDIRPVSKNIDIPVDASGAITKDNQTIGMDITYFYSHDGSKIVESLSKYGKDGLEKMLNSAIIESSKETIGKRTIFDVASSQSEIRSEITSLVKSKISSYPIIVNEIRINNFDWSDAFDKQIADTMAKAQQVKQAEQELKLTEQQAQKQVAQAEATAQAVVKEAEGEKIAAQLRAEAKKLEGQGIADYNAAVAKNMDIEIKLKTLEIEKIRAEKWNGVQPQNNYFVPPVFSSK